MSLMKIKSHKVNVKTKQVMDFASVKFLRKAKLFIICLIVH